jgi:hypothetical protein
MLFEYLKLVEIAILSVMGGVEHAFTFSTLNFMKSKLKNQLTVCLDMVVRMYMQEFDKIRISHFILPLFDEGHSGWSYRCLISFGNIGLHYVVSNNKFYPLINNSLLCQ